MRTTVATFVGICAIGACTPTGGSSARAAASAADTTIDRAPQWDEADAWTVSSEPHVSIGMVDGPAAYELFDVTAAARQSDGDVVVVEGRTREVRLYTSEGSFVRTLGGPGSGPGEFRDPADVLITSADAVIVWDNAAYRITRFDSAGTFVDLQSVDLGGIAGALAPPLYPGPAELLRDSVILVRLLEKTKRSPPGLFRSRSGVLRVAADLSRIDTLMFFGDVERVTARAPWGEWPVEPALARSTLTTVHPTGSRACVGDQERPEVVCIDLDGTRTVARWSSNPAPVGAHDLAIWRDSTIALYAPKIREDEAARMLAQVPAPAVRPHFMRILLDRLGNLWISLDPANDHAGGPVDHLVFDMGGTLLGTVELPPIEVLEIGDDYVMGIHRDALDVQILQIHELGKPNAAPPIVGNSPDSLPPSF